MNPKGMCYLLSEMAYHLLDDWKPYRATYKGKSHWWLQKGEEIVDLSAKQFRYRFPYHLGKPQPFLTSKPSKRTLKAFKAIGECLDS